LLLKKDLAILAFLCREAGECLCSEGQEHSLTHHPLDNIAIHNPSNISFRQQAGREVKVAGSKALGLSSGPKDGSNAYTFAHPKVME